MNEPITSIQDVFEINAEQWCEKIIEFIKKMYSESLREGIVVPISGGLDSSVVAALCVRAVGNDKVLGLMLPERLGNPEAKYYGIMIANSLSIKTKKINISPILRGLGTNDPFLSALSGREFWKGIINKNMQKRGHTVKSDYLASLRGILNRKGRILVAKVGSKQRARLLVTYKYAEENNYLVAGSANKTERMVGLFCKYGIDDSADIMPLKNIYRSQILQLAKCLGIPSQIMERTPNPDILPGITDKYVGYFDLDFHQIDSIIFGVENGLTDSHIANQIGLSEPTVTQIREIIFLSGNYRNHELAPIMVE